jgi:hypothetical protein
MFLSGHDARFHVLIALRCLSKNLFKLGLGFYTASVDSLFVLCQWQENLQRFPLSPPGKSAVFCSKAAYWGFFYGIYAPVHGNP